MSQSIKDILNFFREEAANNRDLGDKFEKLIAAYLTKDPYYANHFSNVWLWTEWPGRNNKPDIGIDLVAQERATGDFTAIQCKFLDPSHYLQREDIDSFFTASGKAPFTRRLIVCTTDIRVIIGNPPYSAKQESINDANQNLKYPRLDERIAVTYAVNTDATNKRAALDDPDLKPLWDSMGGTTWKRAE